MATFLKKHRLIIISAVLCLFALHIVSTNTKGIGGSLITGKVISVISTPFQYGIASAIKGIRSVWTSYIYLINVNRENVSLKNDVDELKQENNQLKEALFLNNRLKELLAFKQEVAAPSVAANVIGIESSGWIRTVTLNKGLSDEIRRDMAIVTPLGIAGRVIDVQPTTSTALLVTDPRCTIDVVVQRTRTKGIAEGNGTDRLTLKYVRHEDDIQIGDILISSGLGGIFQQGRIVGEVVRIEKGEDNFFMNIEIKPGADLKKLEEVLIVTTDKDNNISADVKFQKLKVKKQN
ncbi:MAG: rod shape-determining protein MreC [Deltaproteobacteria bacterium]|nr:rod shape-determining protein MreC [Deltaproteobacteria bacterium]